MPEKVLAPLDIESSGFKEIATPKSPDGLALFKCACGGMHFRHAGYVETQLPFIQSEGKKRISTASEAVKICVACKNAYIWIGESVYDVTSQIDLKAWERTEKEAHRATGPGGDC